MNKIIFSTLCLCMCFAMQVFAAPRERQKLDWVEEYEGPVVSSAISKAIDRKEIVICYILHPDNVRGDAGRGTQTYDANSLGSISCVHIPAEKQTSPNEAKKR